MKKNFFVLISVLFLFFSFNGYAQKTEEISLFEIDRLIKDTEYDKALQLLNNYLKKHPENFDNVQVRIKKIMNARKQYSALAEQLLWIIENEPENSQKIYEITEQLEQFEKNPSNQIKNFIQDAKNGRDISSINDAEQEVLYKNDSTFYVINIVEKDGVYYILLGEKE